MLGSRLLVDNSLQVARAFQISEAVIGLTVVAFGTSVPELATSIVAAVRKQPDIALGNVIGSNIFNILSILGISALVMPIAVNGIQVLDYAMMVGVSLLILPFLMTGLRSGPYRGGHPAGVVWRLSLSPVAEIKPIGCSNPQHVLGEYHFYRCCRRQLRLEKTKSRFLFRPP